jgi:signal transduction histidine kinase
MGPNDAWSGMPGTGMPGPGVPGPGTPGVGSQPTGPAAPSSGAQGYGPQNAGQGAPGPGTQRPGYGMPGQQPGAPHPWGWGRQQRPPLERTPRGYPGRPKPVIAGVASGLAVHLGISVTALRVAFVVLIPIGLPLLYVWLWAFIPKVDGERRYRSERLASALQEPFKENKLSSSAQGFIFGLVMLLIAGFVFGMQLGWWSFADNWIGIALLAAGISLIWSQAADFKNWRNPMVLGLTATGVVLLLGGMIIMLPGWKDNLILPGIGLGLALILVLVFAFSPLLLRLTKELSSTEVARAREAERADIAAHLHDSVLQTLTLIKTNADNPARVRSLALKQERELRSWLYTGKAETVNSFKKLLQDSVESVEQMYGQEAEVVTVGDCIPGPSEQAATAAAAEAVKNAMRHGAPPIQVYAEVGPTITDIYIKDSGPGFDLSEVPEDRHGVRDSIIARSERVGGRVNIRKLNPGTEIHIQVPHSNMEPQ